MKTQKWHRNKTAALNNQILDDDNKLVAVAVGYNDSAEMTNARINLIAAAPELLEALEKFKICFESFNIQAEGIAAQVCWGEAIEFAKKALSKAMGDL